VKANLGLTVKKKKSARAVVVGAAAAKKELKFSFPEQEGRGGEESREI